MTILRGLTVVLVGWALGFCGGYLIADGLKTGNPLTTFVAALLIVGCFLWNVFGPRMLSKEDCQ